MDHHKKNRFESNTRIQSFFLFAISMVFFPILPGVSETQPLLLLILGAVCLLTGRLSVNIYTWMLFYFSGLLLAVAYVSDFNPEFLSELSKLILVLMLVVLAYPWVGFGSKGFYRLFVAIHLFIALMVSLNLTSWLANYFGRYTTLEGGRGISYLASEPSYAATYLFYVALVYTLGLNKGVFNSRIMQWALLILLLSTYSLMGFLFFVLVLAVDISLGKVYKKIVVGGLAALGGIFFFFAVDRVSTELIPLVTSMFSGEVGILQWSLNYPSASTRFILNGSAILDGLQRIFYFPELPFNDALPSILNRFGLGPILYEHEVIGALHSEGVPLKPQALFPYVVYVFGILAVPLLFYPVYVACTVIGMKKYLMFFVCLALIFIFFFYQSQYVNPIQFFVFVVIYKYFQKVESPL
ncbi:hypothetical protein [Pseudomonas rhodesiae]|uniref:hypothetical protein n=1 Tax=Pseudomonas rhodesiae TaxID=76760 RepID=UPI0028A7E284|nr:hypothetical protein [Pseudomonas rhodesiae]